MASNFIGEGETINVVAPSALTSGTPVDLGAGVVVIPDASVASAAVGAVLPQGQFRFPKVAAAIASSIHGAAETITLGQGIFWDATNAVATQKAIGPYLGAATKAAASGAAYVEVLVGLGTQLPGVRVVTGVLDQTLNSSIAAHALPGGTVPAGWLVIAYGYRTITTFTSATDAATISLGVASDGAAGLKAALAISNGANPYDAGAVGLVTAAAPIFTTAARTLLATVAVEALTAGKLTVHAICIPSGIAT